MLFIVYLILGYWAVGKTIYANKIRIGTGQSLFIEQVAVALLVGWILIPIAIIKLLIRH